MESSNPRVVTNATRAPLRCNRVLVPTVVPWRMVTSEPGRAIFSTAPAMAWDGSAGVEKTFRMRKVDPSSHTQSVNVPPLSIAILISMRDFRWAMMLRMKDGRGILTFWCGDVGAERFLSGREPESHNPKHIVIPNPRQQGSALFNCQTLVPGARFVSRTSG